MLQKRERGLIAQSDQGSNLGSTAYQLKDLQQTT